MRPEVPRYALSAMFLLIVSYWLFTSDASACSCAYSGAPCKAFSNTAIVFSGRVADISHISTSHGEQQIATLEVQQNYRGLAGKKRVEVLTGMGGGDCGYNF